RLLTSKPHGPSHAPLRGTLPPRHAAIVLRSSSHRIEVILPGRFPPQICSFASKRARRMRLQSRQSMHDEDAITHDARRRRMTRRDFVSGSSAAVGAALLSQTPALARTNDTKPIDAKA